MRRLALALALLAAPALAQAATTVAFDRPGGGARAAALGGHMVVLPEDDHALGSSPGRLVFAARSASAQYDHVDPDLELWRGRIGVLLPLGADMTVPLQTSHVSRTAVGLALDVTSLTLIEGSGYREAAVSLGGGFAPFNILGLGLVARYEHASSDVTEISAGAWGVDFGAAVDLTDHLAAALAIRNAMGRASFDSGDDEDRPAELTIGFAAGHHKWWQAELDWVIQNSTTSALSGGVEVHVVPGMVDLRAGIAREQDPVSSRMVPSAGAGFEFARVHLDYAFRADTDGTLDAQHQLALTARF